MITESGMYWLTRLDGINVGLTIGMVASLLVAFVFFMVSVMKLDEYGKSKEIQRANFKECISRAYLPAFFAIFFLVALILTPSMKSMAAIKVVPLVANSEDVQSIGTGVVDLANEWIQELKPRGE